jgi:hypothetical protein
VEGLVGEIKKYNPKDGEVNREIILQEHNVVRGVDQILFIVRRIV